MYKALVFDLDGTLTEPRQKISEEMLSIVKQLQKTYMIIILGAGNCQRIYEQINMCSSLCILGNYGLEAYNTDDKGMLQYLYRHPQPLDADILIYTMGEIRKKYDLTVFTGLGYEVHPTGMITFALLGTTAPIEEKLKFDPDKKKRYEILPVLQTMLPNHNIIIGGTSSFDILPKGINKKYGIEMILDIFKFQKEDIQYFGDAIQPHENDDGIQDAGIDYIEVIDSNQLKEVLRGYID